MVSERKGIVLTLICYVIWGVFPLFWKQLSHVPAMEILTSRVIWSFGFTLLFLVLIRQAKHLKEDIASLFRVKKQFFSLVAAAFLIAMNWYIFIWAVTNDHVLQSSLGYYMNPLISVLFGVLFFKERLSKATLVSVIVASCGVLILTVSYGQVPWVSLLLALTFALYSVCKKNISIEATRGLVIETLFVLPFAVAYTVYLYKEQQLAFLHIDWQTDVLLLLGGILTAVPLVLFAKGAQSIPLYLIGFLQFSAPTISFCIGVFVYKEPFTSVELAAFSCIWLAVVIFSVAKVKEIRMRTVQ